MLDKNPPPKKEQVTPKPAVTIPKPSETVDFGVRHAPHLKKLIDKMNHQELEVYGKRIGISFKGNKTTFLGAALAKYQSQQ